MNPGKKSGIIFIVIAICIPLLVLPFLSGFSREKGLIDNLYSVGIQIAKDRPDNGVGNGDPSQKRKITWGDIMPRRIQFRFILAISVILLFVGFVRIERSRHKDDGPGEP